jgi:AbrB family looped-hinge helix DNA binding protein
MVDGIVKRKVSLDEAGRVVLPKHLRDKLRLEPGDELLVDDEGEQITSILLCWLPLSALVTFTNRRASGPSRRLRQETPRAAPIPLPKSFRP